MGSNASCSDDPALGAKSDSFSTSSASVLVSVVVPTDQETVSHQKGFAKLMPTPVQRVGITKSSATVFSSETEALSSAHPDRIVTIISPLLNVSQSCDRQDVALMDGSTLNVARFANTRRGIIKSDLTRSTRASTSAHEANDLHPHDYDEGNHAHSTDDCDIPELHPSMSQDAFILVASRKPHSIARRHRTSQAAASSSTFDRLSAFGGSVASQTTVASSERSELSVLDPQLHPTSWESHSSTQRTLSLPSQLEKDLDIYLR